ncbi:hypothetical protein L3Q82_003050 [Scortum barcoo]|uniref:Uncharacterized protein n=1 Tax=Scortum barcoo TaxID=214431 RepID=A0ACB8VRI8_9TELE|nr:hypothetical protein L3Q82_003050 [Scortum barcoo]
MRGEIVLAPQCSSETASLPGDTSLSVRVDKDAMSDKSDLKAELERKKQRLAQIREEKKRKEEERKKKEAVTHKRPRLCVSVRAYKHLCVWRRSGFSKNKSQAQSSRTLQWDTDPSVLQLQADSELGRRMLRLGASKITQVDFLPKEVVSYCKETQTPLNAHLSEVAKTAGSHVTVKGVVLPASCHYNR